MKTMTKTKIIFEWKIKIGQNLRLKTKIWLNLAEQIIYKKISIKGIPAPNLTYSRWNISQTGPWGYYSD